MEVVLVIATVLLLASVGAAVALDRRASVRRIPPTPAGAPAPPAADAPPATALVEAALPAAGRWAGLDASVRACDDLQARLRAGLLTAEDYRRAMASLAARHERRHPLAVPPDA
jgi:hypothetical protein